MGYSGTVLFPGHHTGKLYLKHTLIYTGRRPNTLASFTKETNAQPVNTAYCKQTNNLLRGADSFATN